MSWTPADGRQREGCLKKTGCGRFCEDLAKAITWEEAEHTVMDCALRRQAAVQCDDYWHRRN